MPCHVDGPSKSAIDTMKAAKLLVFALGVLKRPVPAYVIEAAKDDYPYSISAHVTETAKIEPELCALMLSLSQDQIRLVAYNAYSRESRDLADWWETHQENDRRHEKEEADKREKERLVRSALGKLTNEEKRALGLR
jgi:hypothetical protein